LKMLNTGLLTGIHGCISTGKESNLYLASTKNSDHNLILKVYKTSNPMFKDRDCYLTGNSRFNYNCPLTNPKKIIQFWAEKEFRNLTKIYQSGVLVPRPEHLNMHMVFMEFLGEGGISAPKIKDADLTKSRLHECYYDAVHIVRRLYWECKIVHADLNEYNIIYYKSSLYVIDVSQSVDVNNPHSHQFLWEDCTHITKFFQKQGIFTIPIKKFFDFVVDPNIINIDVKIPIEKTILKPYYLIKIKETLETNLIKTDIISEKIRTPKIIFQNCKGNLKVIWMSYALIFTIFILLKSRKTLQHNLSISNTKSEAKICLNLWY
jgi:RIO kinase 1